ncbi:MAG: DMT family transporter [Succinatimonas sp.]|nr:DMT family transporter [Succinatimonas sp.]
MKVLFLMHFSVFLAGFTGLLGRAISVDSYSIVFWRMVFAVACYALFVIFFHPLKHLSRAFIVKSMLVGATLMVHLVFFYWSIKLSNVSIGVITLSCMGFFTAILEPLLFKYKLSYLELFFSIISIVGIMFIFGFDSRYRLGIGVGLFAAVISAIFCVGTKVIAAAPDYLTVLFWQLSGGLLALLLFLPFYLYLFGTQDFLPSPMDWGYLIFLGSVCTSFLYLLQLYVVTKLSAFTLALTTNLEPIYSIIMAMIIFNEAQELNFSFYLGLIFIATSVILQTNRSYKLELKNK